MQPRDTTDLSLCSVKVMRRESCAAMLALLAGFLRLFSDSPTSVVSGSYVKVGNVQGEKKSLRGAVVVVEWLAISGSCYCVTDSATTKMISIDSMSRQTTRRMGRQDEYLHSHLGSKVKTAQGAGMRCVSTGW